ncbi:MAG: membrane protein insertase YidC, partial [Treponema sp.]|nr:membrane protein insertase YidC [Treponema sp.]
MEKRTLLAVALSMVVMLVFFWLQATLYPPPEPVSPTGQTPPEISEFSGPSVPAPTVTPPEIIEETGPSQDSLGVEVIADEAAPARIFTIETNLLSVILTNAGGEIVSYRLKDHDAKGEPVEMILYGDARSQAFAVAFGSYEDVIAKRVKPVERNFQTRRISDLIIEFYQDFQVPSGGIFTMTKRYEFKPNEYMFELTVTLNGGNSISGFDFSGAAYTLIYGPQIGPEFERLDQRYEYRRYLTYKGKLNTERVNERNPTVITTQPSWAA